MIETEVFCEFRFTCRACLETGRLYSIHEYQLADYFNELIGTKVLPHDGLPQHLCAMCATTLLKIFEFKKQCIKVQSVLDNLKKKQHVITSHSDLEKKKISKKYTQTITKITEYPNTHTNKDKDCPHIYYDHIKPIKKEVEMYVDNFSMKVEGTSTDSYHSQLYIDEGHINDEINEISDTGFVKVDTELSNEIFSIELEKENIIKLTKKIKENKVEPIKQKVRKRKFKIKNGKSEENYYNENKTKFKRAPKINKIEGKYFETKENMSNFECMYDVEIVVLSKEQQLSDILVRKSSPNYLNSPFKCQYCFKGFIDEDNLTKHFKSQHDPSRGAVVCEFCQFRYRDKRGLNQHLKSHRLKFVCRQCRYVSRTTYNAKEHHKMHRGLMHKCKDCGKSYEKLSTYLTHMRAHHPAELVWCDFCGDSFVGAFGLNGHKKRAHRDLKFPPECACECGARFTNTAALHHHASTEGCGQSPCTHCGAAFDSPMLLKDHLLEKHKIGKEYYTCSKCTKTFRNESLYSAHYRRMHAESNRRTNASQPWVCEVCGKTLPNKCRLVYHQRVHTGERPYQCPQCPKSFTMSKLLRSHSRVHTTDRPYACKLCPKTFKGPSALRGHEYMHTGGKIKNTRKNI